MDDIEAVPESSDLYPPDHVAFMTRIDTGHRSTEDRNVSQYVSKVRTDKKDKEPKDPKNNDNRV